MSHQDKRRPKYRPEPIARMLDGYMRKHPGARRARGLAALKQDWASVVGPDFKDIAWPEKFEPSRDGRPGALAVRAAPGAALLLQHDGPRLVERINGYLGAEAIARIRIAPGAPPAKRPRPMPARPLAVDDPQTKAIAGRAGAIEDDALAAALVRLGRAVGGQKK